MEPVQQEPNELRVALDNCPPLRALDGPTKTYVAAEENF